MLTRHKLIRKDYPRLPGGMIEDSILIFRAEGTKFEIAVLQTTIEDAISKLSMSSKTPEREES